MRRYHAFLGLLLAAACGSTDGNSMTGTTDGSTSAATDTGTEGSSGSTTGEVLEGYDDPALWLCHPDAADGEDHCEDGDLRATRVFADGTTEIVEHQVATDPGFDCFYVYPTVDIRLSVGATENFDDISQELDPLLSQAAPFASMCRVFAPLYHQATLGSLNQAEGVAFLDAAYADVEAAFASYLDRHGGERPFVILGHSQGTYMTTRLVREVIEPDAALRDRMIVAALIGGSVGAPDGETVGGTFSQIPICSAADESGCVLGWRAYAQDLPPTSGAQPKIAGEVLTCTHPGSVTNERVTLSGTRLPTLTNQEAIFPQLDFGQTIDTPFVIYPDFYSAACEPDSDGQPFLSIALADANDPRPNPIDFNAPLLNPGFLGLHIFDYNFVMPELLNLVAMKAAAHAGS